MIGVLARILTGPIVGAVKDVFIKHLDREMSEAEMEAEIQKAVAGTIESVASDQAGIITAEAKGESWLQRNWRPTVALTAFFSYWFVIVAYPFLLSWGVLPPVKFGEIGLQNMFYLTTVCVGGYIGGRTIEKVAGVVRG